MSEPTADIRRLACDDDSLRALLAENPPRLFASPDWLTVLGEGFRSEVTYYALFENDRPVVALPGIVLDLKLVRMFYAGMPYGGAVGPGERLPELLRGIDTVLRRDRIDVLRLVRTWFDDFPPPEGFSVRRAVQHVLEIEPAREGARRLPSSIRRNVKKAEKAGVTVETVESTDEMKRLFELYRETMQRHHAAVFWPWPFMESLCRRLVPAGTAEVLAARREGEVLAGMILLHDRDVTYYFLGASKQEALAMRPNDLLFETVIRRCEDAGRRYFDFMTSSAQDDGLARFKEKWGARRETFGIYEKTVSLKGRLLWGPVWWLGNSRIGPPIGRAIGLWG